MMFIMNSPNHLEDLKILEYYYKEIAPKIAEQCLQNIFHGKKRCMTKKSLDKQVETNLNISEDENQRGKISISQ